MHAVGGVCSMPSGWASDRRREGKDEDDSFGADGVEFARYRTKEKRGLLGPAKGPRSSRVCVGSVTCSTSPRERCIRHDKRDALARAGADG